MVVGGESGGEILAADSSHSELWLRVTSSEKDYRMPPDGSSLSAEELTSIKEWLVAGAPWEAGVSFGIPEYAPPLKPRLPQLPAAHENRQHPIDRIIDQHLLKNNQQLPAVVDDAVFIRRVYLDLVGLLPTTEEVEHYIASQDTNKRELLIRELLSRDIDYTENWLTFWNDLLRNDYSGTGFITGGREQISGWLYQALVTNKPYDVMVRELIAPPTGDSAGFGKGIRWRGTVSAGQTIEIQFAQNVGQAFLGINLKCASCHDSFIDRWKLKDAYGLAAVYANSPLQMHRCDKPIGQEAKAAWLFPELGDINPESPQPERLQQLAKLLTSPENGRFSRTLANRMWHRLMGYGIVHPTDAMETKPWNEDLLDYLAYEFAAQQYDLKELLYLITTSEAYRSAVERVQEKESNDGYQYAGPRAKRLTAEQFVDAVWQLTGAAPKTFDAPVVRIKPDDKSVPAIGDLQGKWIWSETANQTGGPAAGELVTFRKSFQLTEKVRRAAGVITCDNGYTLWLNGQKLAEDGNWENVEIFEPASHLQVGKNEIVVVGSNAGSGPNPAALFLELLIETESGTERLATSTDWEVTAGNVVENGKVKQADLKWSRAVEAAGPWGGRLGGELTQSLARGLAVGSKMVRASLVKADFLMRSLGRPNRDQIVTVRPTELTQLEAMDLSNGETLANWLRQGATRIHTEALADNSDKQSVRVIEDLYMRALCRAPSPAEREAIQELVGEELEAQELEDILWAIIMLPEFQYIR